MKGKLFLNIQILRQHKYKKNKKKRLKKEEFLNDRNKLKKLKKKYFFNSN